MDKENFENNILLTQTERLQMYSSYVCTDPKGTILLEVGKMLFDNGYRIKVLNTINFTKSNHYNPFA